MECSFSPSKKLSLFVDIRLKLVTFQQKKDQFYVLNNVADISIESQSSVSN